MSSLGVMSTRVISKYNPTRFIPTPCPALFPATLTTTDPAHVAGKERINQSLRRGRYDADADTRSALFDWSPDVISSMSVGRDVAHLAPAI